MSGLAERDRDGGLAERLAAAERLLATAGPRLPDVAQRELEDVVERARGRLAVTGDHTVVALAGPTGVGKSTTTNALLGVDLAVPGVVRPTTAQPLAIVVGDEPLRELASHLGLERWEHVGVAGREQLAGLVLVDLPDHDSVVTAHRERAAEMVAVADRLVWVVDPEKYADASVHDDLLAPLHAHAGVLSVVCNRIDRVPPEERERLLADLRGLLRARGLGAADVLGVSARTGDGLDELRALLARTVADHRAVARRLDADLRAAADALDDALPAAPDPHAVTADTDALVEAALVAAGVPGVLDAAAATHRHRARRATGWPPLRRLQSRGLDPLHRLGLGRGRERGEVGTRSARALPQGVATAHVASALRTRVEATAAGWPAAWRDPLGDELDRAVEQLPVALDRAVAGTDLDDDRHPAWWRLVGGLQWLLLAALLVGLGWLAVLFAVAWFQLPPPPVPEVGAVPLPTVLAVGSAAAGLLVGALAAVAAAVGARRARARIRARLGERVAATVERQLLAVLDAEQERADAARTALATVRGDDGARSGGRWRGRGGR